MKIRLLVLGLAVCMIATPASADLFNFTVHSPRTTYDGTSTFDVSFGSDTILTLSRNVAPTGTVQLDASTPTLGDFTISMTISNIDNTSQTADGVGTFIITDTDGTADTIFGNIAGTWSSPGSSNIFIGTLSNVMFNDNGTADGDFDGDAGSVSMSFAAPPPWYGEIIQLVTSSADWFGTGDPWDLEGGSIDATVVPVPAAVLLGILGLGVVGLKLRKYA